MADLEVSALKIGTCGFPVARKKYYAEFDVVEIQKTFYTPISEKLAQKWRGDAPSNFEFTLKAPQMVTHPPKSPTYRRYKGKMGDFGYFKVNEDVLSIWEQFVTVAKILRAKVIVFQSPRSFKPTDENIRNIHEFFSTVERDFIYGWEPRGDWDPSTVRKICEELNLVHVVDPFKSPKMYGEFGYYRLHGITGYRYRYSDDELFKLKTIIGEKDYVMFNNTNMWEDARRFKALL